MLFLYIYCNTIDELINEEESKNYSVQYCFLFLGFVCKIGGKTPFYFFGKRAQPRIALK